ncbi:MAG: hypothetical protein U0183_28765 [Polyangiaceae bacterium]
MSTEDLSDLRTRALRAYERGRLWTSFVRAAVVVLATGALSWFVRGHESLVALPLVFVIVAGGEWIGSLVGQGMRRGAALGLATWLVPMSILRPCCSTMDAAARGAACCTMPSCCVATGAVMGLVLAFFAPRARDTRAYMWGSVGLAAGALGVTALRCTGLFAGEALGLLGGITLATLAVSFARLVWLRRVA